jgi:serine phosphatase RsbU (regulator of sigma subunit)
MDILGKCRALKNESYTLYEIKGDIMPISIYDQMDSFIKHEIQLLKDDILYIATDGYADQFDRNNHLKFKKRPFKKLLLSISNKSMKEQLSIIDKTFQQWKGKNEQTDDVCIWGIRI